MTAWTPLARNTHALRLAGARLTWYRLAGDVRSLTIQRAVVDRLLDERLTITQSAHAALITASKAVQSSEDGLANVSGRFPHLGAGHVWLDETQISELVGDLNRAVS